MGGTVELLRIAACQLRLDLGGGGRGGGGGEIVGLITVSFSRFYKRRLLVNYYCSKNFLTNNSFLHCGFVSVSCCY